MARAFIISAKLRLLSLSVHLSSGVCTVVQPRPPIQKHVADQKPEGRANRKCESAPGMFILSPTTTLEFRWIGYTTKF